MNPGSGRFASQLLSPASVPSSRAVRWLSLGHVMADAGGPAYHYVCGAAVGPMDQGPLAPVPAAAHASPEEASCPCLICHEVCVLGPLRLTFLAWLSAASCLGVTNSSSFRHSSFALVDHQPHTVGHATVGCSAATRQNGRPRAENHCTSDNNA